MVANWTESRYWGFLRSMLRRGFQRYPNKHACMANARRKVGRKSEYECASCSVNHRRKDVAVDHIKPCGTLRSYADLATFAENMFCPVEGLQVLCKGCHYTKTMGERGMTHIDIEIARFKKRPAPEQKKIIGQIFADRNSVWGPGSNQSKRVEQLREFLLGEDT